VRCVVKDGHGAPPLKIELTEYLNSLYGYAVALSRDRTSAEDLVQETCLRAVRGMARLGPPLLVS
jgi:DNA-directed RNA polymerase specialized sigma24 family protein